ncbi:hypothetical protein ABTZ59_29235 [Streptomyces sp. NPDC094034]|uniref:hypothetical protein n=1 Tax=Streptomyces sp. NPDC094034 TaxID=3155309 RepID=UPI00331D022B
MKAAPEKSSAAAVRADVPRSSAPARETAPSPDVSTASAPGPRLTARSLQRLQGRAGNAAVSRLVAQRYAEVVKPPPAQAPGFRKVQQDVAAKKQRIKQHKTAASESKSAQDAAVAPPDDKQAQGKAANAEKMNEAKPGEFDKNAFVGAVNEAIAAQAPKNLDEADGFADSGKADSIKDSVDGKVKEGKESSAEEIESTTAAAPDTSQAKEKQVTPMGPDQPPGNPGAPSAADAVPDKQPDKVLDFSEGNQRVDQQMADAEVTEEQLAKGNEPQFDAALSEKKKGEQHTASVPAKGRAAEAGQLSAAQAGAAASGAAAMTAMTADRAAAGKAVDGGKGETKSADEKKREQVTAKLQKVFDATQKDVEKILGDLDGKVDRQFTEGEKKARDDFTADHKRRMKQYKDKRYSGFTGKGRWIRDKFKGLPQEGLDIFKKSRELYVTKMQAVISSIADTIGTELGRAKARIATGRAELKAEVDRLPADLKQFGEEAAADFAGKFDDLESEVNDKSTQLVQDLAQKYTEALNSVDEEIKKLEEENKGLIAKVVDAVAGVIQTIMELKNLLMGILAKAAGAIGKIIKDPIGFLKNLVSGVGSGLNLFIGNIATHLQKGLVSWLLGTAVSTGLEIPARFDIKGIIQLIASLLGLTWDNIRARVTRKGVPNEAMTKAEQSVPIAQALAREGPAGAAQEITAETGDLKSTILDDLKSYLIPTVLMAGITWILSLLNPASAFIRAVKGIIDIVTFIVTQGAQIVEFVNAVLDAVVAIANGAAAAVPKTVETALAASIPLLIGLLASLLGIGGLANRVRQAFQKVSRPVNRAIDKIVDKIAKAAKKLVRKNKKTSGDPGDRKRGAEGGDPRRRDRRNENEKRDAVRAAIRDVERVMGSDDNPRSVVERALPGIRRRRRVNELFLIDSADGSYRARAKINPEADSAEDSDVDLVGRNLIKHGDVLIGKVHSDWWDKQLQHPEVSNAKVWSDSGILPPTDVLAKNYLNDREVHKKVTKDYYADGRSDPTNDNFFARVLGNSEKYARRDTVEALGRAALGTVRKAGLGSVQDSAVEKILRKMRFLPDEGHYGRFHPFPRGQKSPDRDLEQAIEGVSAPPREKIIEFLRRIMEGETVGKIDWSKFKDLWRNHGNSRRYVKGKFREADGGKHEWIPTNYIENVMEFAVEHRSNGRLKAGQDWMTLHHKLRSFTSDVIYRIEIPPDAELITRGAIGAHVGAFITVTDRTFVFNEGDDPWHNGLRGLFDGFVAANPEGTALEFLGVLQAKLPESGSSPEVARLIWDPEVQPIPASMRNVKVDAIYRRITVGADGVSRTDERVNIELGDLEALQRINYDRVHADFALVREILSRE